MQISIFIQRIALALCLVSLPVLSFAQWYIIPTGVTKPIEDVQFVNNNIVYAIGDSAFLKSTDGGHNWVNLYINISLVADPSFDHLLFLNTDTGFIYRLNIIGAPTLLRTTDGGQSWANISSPSMTQGVNDMFFVNDSVGYACGGIGGGHPFCRTSDGGLNWTLVTSPTIDASISLYFLSELVGFSGNGGIRKTEDGGNSWISATGVPNDENIVDYYFFNATHGVSVASDYSVYLTQDAGDTWSASWGSPFATVGTMCREMAFTDSLNHHIKGFMVGEVFVPAATIDSGVAWGAYASFPSSYQAICVDAADHVFIFGTTQGDVFLYYPPITGVDNPSLNESNVTLYPNPSAGLFCVSSKDAIRSVSVYTIHGQCIFDAVSDGHNKSMQIDLTGKANGVYFVQVNGENSSQTKTMLVK